MITNRNFWELEARVRRLEEKAGIEPPTKAAPAAKPGKKSSARKRTSRNRRKTKKAAK